MRYGSVCSGIEAATVAWGPLGWKAAWFSEIDAFPSAVLAHYYPNIENKGDFTRIHDDRDAGPIDVLVGGTPCQSFSVAGLREGLDDPRGNLALEFLRLADALRPRWIVWENVPGVLSSTSGQPAGPPPDRVGVGPGERVVVEDEYEERSDFGCFLAALSELGYGWAYRVLDAQFFGVPQRRRRVFVVGHPDWRRAAAVLFERDCMSGNPPPRREAGAGVAPSVTPGARRASGQRSGELFAPVDGTVADVGDGAGVRDVRRVPGDDGLIPETATTVTGRQAKGPDSDCTDTLIAHTLRGEGFDASEDGTGRGTPLVPVAFQERGRTGGRQAEWSEGLAYSLTAPSGGGRRHEMNVAVPVAFTSKDHGQDAGHLSPTLRAMQGQHANGGGQLAVAVPIDMRQASRGGTMTNNRPEGSSGGAPGTGIGAPGDPSPSISLSHPPAVAYQCHGNNVGPMGTLRSGDGGLTSGIPFIVNAAESCAKKDHARESEVSRCLDSSGGFASSQGGTVVAQPYNIVGLGQQGRNRAYPAEVSGCLQHKGLAASGNEAGTVVAQGVDLQNTRIGGDTSGTLDTTTPSRGGGQAVMQQMAVRRLTPVECERLQGFPDNYTLIPWRGRPADQCPDGPRYKALGNSMAVPVMRWIGERIAFVDAIPAEGEAPRRAPAVHVGPCRGLVRPPVKIHGGKYPIASWIVSLMPEHDTYIEPFLGGGSVFLSKPEAENSYLGDRNEGLIATWRAIRDHSASVAAILRMTPYCRESFDHAKGLLGDEDEAVVAAATIIRSRFSRGGDSTSFGESTRLRGGKNEYVNSWETFLAVDFPKIVDKIQDAFFYEGSFRESIPQFAAEGALVYLDPPYLPETRTTLGTYEHEMSVEDHADLLDLLLASPAKVMLSGYRCGLYDDRLVEWNRHDKAVANHASQKRTKSRRIESVWTNF